MIIFINWNNSFWIDILLVPKYPVSGIGHFGLPIAEEDAILFKKESASEKDKQQSALLMAKMFAEFVRVFPLYFPIISLLPKNFYFQFFSGLEISVS